jgi:hypothetical protein
VDQLALLVTGIISLALIYVVFFWLPPVVAALY